MGSVTLLDLVQNVLATGLADQVNSIGDTQEALAVANIVRNSYFMVLNERNDYTFNRNTFQLDSLADPTTPTIFSIPQNVTVIQFFKYNRKQTNDDQERFEDLIQLELSDFLTETYLRSSKDDNVEQMSFNLNKFLIYNDRPPTYFTTIDDQYILCDSYNKSIENTLMSSKTILYATIKMPWLFTDDFVPTMPDHMVEIVLHTSIAAYAQLRGEDNKMSEIFLEI